VFGSTETHRFHFDGIVDGLPERDVAMHSRVEKARREVMSRMIPRAARRQSQPR
jgi:hypothetical protein